MARATLGKLREEFTRGFWIQARRSHVPNLRRAPHFELLDADRGSMRLSDFLGLPCLFVFTSPHCGPCTSLYGVLPKLAELSKVRVVLFSRGANSTNRRLKLDYGLDSLPVLSSRREVEGGYGVRVTPHACLISADGFIVEGGPANDCILAEMAERASHPLIVAT